MRSARSATAAWSWPPARRSRKALRQTSCPIPRSSAPIWEMTMLEVKQLSISYGQHRALEDASLKIGRGEIVVILGANGAGKSSLLKAVSGICEGRAYGNITMQGRDILGLPANRIVEEGIA